MICEFCNAILLPTQTCQDLYNQLVFYTLAHLDREFFIHQLIVDAYAAQHAKPEDKPIKITFALIGLYLFAEKQYTGKEVQKAHMWLGNLPSQLKQWPARIGYAKGVAGGPGFKLSKIKVDINAGDVLAEDPGNQRDEMIKSWAKAVWQANIENRQEVINLLAKVGFKI